MLQYVLDLKTSAVHGGMMENFTGHFVSVVWDIIPIFLLFFLITGILFFNYYRIKREEELAILRQIAKTLYELNIQNNYKY